MSRLSTLRRLADALAPLSPAARVAIDRPDAAGKTTLADELAPMLGAARIRGDDFVDVDPEVRELADAILDNSGFRRPGLVLRGGEDGRGA